MSNTDPLTTPNPLDELAPAGPKGQWAHLVDLGDTVTGTVLDPFHDCKRIEKLNTEGEVVRYKKSGDPRYELRFVLATSERNPDNPDDDGTRIWDANENGIEAVLAGLEAYKRAGGDHSKPYQITATVTTERPSKMSQAGYTVVFAAAPANGAAPAAPAVDDGPGF